MAAPFAGVDGLFPPPPAVVSSSGAMNGDENVRCSRCGFGNCDIRVAGCGCTLHARCTPIKAQSPLTSCPHCMRATTGFVLFPMSFAEVDEARKVAAAHSKSGKRNRKRKAMSQDDSKSVGPGGKLAKKTLDQDKSDASDRRTGRWTNEEVSYCDKLVEKFKEGQLPIVDGTKLNEFLGNMLKSKQSRLTKKMKNARLSSQTYERTSGYIVDPQEARIFSELEESFYLAIQSDLERAEMKFHMQRDWRELFSNFCVKMGQPLDADAWLSSVEEVDRRSAMAKDAARMARRKLMMGYALSQDAKNLQRGVFIEQTETDRLVAQGKLAPGAPHGIGGGVGATDADCDDFLSLFGENADAVDASTAADCPEINGKSSLLHAAPFMSKVVSYMQRHGVPFEHVDAWVPSFVATEDGSEGSEQKCRLCFAGSATTEVHFPNGTGPSEDMSQEDHFNLLSFGDYSQKFSFDVGCGLPGRVYQSGVPTWEQSVHNAPHHHFERCGGAMQWGIKTVVGIPVPSPNVGRIVVVLYSKHDRNKDQDMVSRLCDEFTKLMPSPKWKLVVDVSPAPPTETVTEEISAVTSAADAENVASIPTAEDGKKETKDNPIDQIVCLLGEHMPSDPSSPLIEHVPGFMSLRLMLLRASRTEEEEELVQTMLGSYSSYKASGRSTGDIAVMLARDFTFLTQAQQQQAPTNSIHFLGALPADDFLYKHSPALTPIIPSSSSLNDVVSIVSN